MLSAFKAALSSLPQSLSRTWEFIGQSHSVAVTSAVIKRFSSNYNPYENYETSLPHKPRRGNRRFYEYKLFTGGLLPRPEGKWEDKPLPTPPWNPSKKDQWTPKKALFGQNDYIDILGDGTIHPADLHRAPIWLKGFRGTEFQRISRQLAAQGTFLKETFPTKYHQLRKQMRFLYRRDNRRRHAGHWGGRTSVSRIDVPRLRY